MLPSGPTRSTTCSSSWAPASATPLRGVADVAAAQVALEQAVDWLERVDRVFSTYRDDSAVSRLRRDEEVAAEDAALVEEVARALRDRVGG